MSRFDAFTAMLDCPVHVVTAAVGEERAGCLVGFAGQCSIRPPRFTVWISKANHTYTVASRADTLAVHLLSRQRHDLAELFGGLTGDRVDKFTAVRWTPARTASPSSPTPSRGSPAACSTAPTGATTSASSSTRSSPAPPPTTATRSPSAT